uniref:Zinc ribbon domain-containing protein n=1 Tax=candidate division WOR-3 bacterium TaxID=2052148 RepID=A0A7C4UC49_UNCW3
MKKFLIIFLLISFILFAEDFKICPKCGAKNPIDAVFCGNCGYKFEEVKKITEDTIKDFIICPNCGAKNPNDAQYCYNCGFPLIKLIKKETKPDTSIFTSPIAESIYAELVKIRKILYSKEIESKYKKDFDQTTNNIIGGILLFTGCVLIFILITR